MRPTPLLLRPILVWGLIIGGGTALLFELSYWSGAYLTWWGGPVYKSLVSLGPVVAMFIALNIIRWRERAQLTLPRSLVYGILIGAVVGLVMTAHDAVFFRHIDPAYTHKLLDSETARQRQHRQRLESLTPRPDYLISQADKAIAAIAAKRAETAAVEADLGRTLLANLSNSVLTCVIAALLMGIILRNIPMDAPARPVESLPADPAP